MAVSKRLRFEILRRDNHQCRYCGRSAPEVALTVDHVVPTTLGGTDEPANLVAACGDCNAGKSSMPADAAIVADVEAKAMLWARAMDIVAQGRDFERYEAALLHDNFIEHWGGWAYTNREAVEIPDDWRASVTQFIKAGLQLDDLIELVDVAMSARTRDTWRYFCGCCWRRIHQTQEHARAIITTWEAEGRNG